MKINENKAFGYDSIGLGVNDYAVAKIENHSLPAGNSIAIGPNIKINNKNCILIGSDLKSEHDYQLIIGNTEVKVTRELTDNEFNDFRSILISIICGQT